MKDVRAARPRRKLSKQRLRLWLRLLRVSRDIEADLRERLRVAFATTMPRFDVLAALHRTRAGLRMSDISGELKVSNGNVTGIIDRLVQDGWVKRVEVPGDRRASLIRLTPDGEERFAAMAAEHEAWLNNMFAELSAHDIDSLMDLLRRLRPGPGATPTAPPQSATPGGRP